MFTLAQVLLLLLIVLCVYDIFLLFFLKKNAIRCTRECDERFSNGDDNKVRLHLFNRYPFPVSLQIVDEIPPIFQIRDLLFNFQMQRQEDKVLSYSLRPVKRGVYSFGNINVFASTKIGLIRRRFKAGTPCSLKVYPSYSLLKEYELLATTNQLKQYGNKKIRQIGQQLEPDQIKDYVKGDDYRIINWKATARRSKLMVNVFQEERAQNIYCLIDKGRTMQSAFNRMTLLDYSINASLALSYVAMLKGDKAGLLTFERTFDTMIPASRNPKQIHLILDALYAQKTTFAESDFQALYQQTDKQIKNRSLLLVFTNFDSVPAMQRQLLYLSLMAKRHTVLVVFFENAELQALSKIQPANKEQAYETVIAEKLEYEKMLIVQKLRQRNILSLLTHPNDLTVNVINKYLDIKARGL
ncbi:hypothetical protein FACS1894176_09780 [Bacteroidia bacterium]|nr:hypothetical protein FACS1894176_09780 [Bacteroidia bacterium]